MKTRPPEKPAKSTGSYKNCYGDYEAVGHATQNVSACALTGSHPHIAWRGQNSIVDRFWARVRKTDDCWWWTGTVCSRYGQIALGHPSTPGAKRWRTHRFSWELHFGPIPTGLVVCHKCDNPLCVRPDHLFLGTQAENVHDSARKGRKNAWGLQKLNAEDVQVIREQAARGLRQKDIAAAFGISRNHVSSIVHRTSWAHLDHPTVTTATRKAS